MSYVVLARKWRPIRFEDLVGQEHVARTLANAIASGRVAHAFLFTGVRGVGKTTSARLLARALNCMGPPGAQGAPDPGPTATPCLKCAACLEITQGADVDVREIDGASYNGVDEVRKLQDSLPYRPARDRYKVFIIDEVHMLSQSAWNAFLKTLEEPPPHVKFIFATTEVHKVPVTILSRVQRFDFKLIPTRMIVDRLRTVLEAEGVASDNAGLSIIARQAAGSMRDAMSLLDQVIAWNDQTLDGDSVARVLGVASRRILHELAAAVVDGNMSESLNIVDQLSQQGFDLGHVCKDFLELLRDLVVARVCTDSTALIDLPDEERADASALAARTSPDDVLRLYHGFSAGFDDVLRGSHPRSALEMLLVRLCRRPPLLPLDDLVSRLAAMERRLLGAAPAGLSGSNPTPPNLNTPQRRPQASPMPTNSAVERPRAREDRSAPSQRPTSGGGRAEDDPDPAALTETAPAPLGNAQNRATTNPQSSPHEPRSSGVPPAAAQRRPPDAQTGRNVVAATNQPKTDSPTADATAPDEDELMAIWQEIVEKVMANRPDVSAVLEHAILLEAEGDRLVVGWPPDSVFANQFETPQLSEWIQSAAGEAGRDIHRVSVVSNDPRACGRDTLSSLEIAERTKRYREDQARVRNHPRVKDAQEILGGRLLAIKLADR
jgi:DNA polymerase III subunit gamma/tau